MEKIMRKIVEIDESKCDGCGLCIPSCAEGALKIIDGKAKLVKDLYCDGLGNCLGECPQDAIAIIEREAEPFDEEAVEEYIKTLDSEHSDLEDNCPGCTAIGETFTEKRAQDLATQKEAGPLCSSVDAELSHWPIQLHLVPSQARFLQDKDLLIAADCVPFAYADFHRNFLAGKSLIICCPKLDDVAVYHKKLVEIFRVNKLKSITLAHMEVGCCFGLSALVKKALQESGADIQLKEIIIGVDGTIKEH